jgi:hypothetical protein
MEIPTTTILTCIYRSELPITQLRPNEMANFKEYENRVSFRLRIIIDMCISMYNHVPYCNV